MLAQISLIKGWGFVFVTALLLYFLVRREMAAVRFNESRYRLLAEKNRTILSVMLGE